MLVDGNWDADWHPVQNKDDEGRFVRQTSTFRNWITPDGSPGPDGQKAYPAELGRYHLFVAYICPWASRTLMVRTLKGLEEVISVSVLDPRLSKQGWKFGDFEGSTGKDTEIGASYLHNIYTHCDPKFTGRATVPLLWDKQSKTIINNESADIIQILNSAFKTFSDARPDLRPATNLSDINTLNATLYDAFNNGVYKAGFASSQMAYEEGFTDVFKTLGGLENRLSDGREYLIGNHITESDIRAFVTLIRFDIVYVGLFKLNLRRVADYKHLNAYMLRILALPGIRKTVNIDHIKAGYYSVKAVNPSGIIPAGPDLAELGIER